MMKEPMEIEWAAWYQPEWDEQPERYSAEGVVGWSRSRRLAKAHDDRLSLKAYIGVQHDDPARWNVSGVPSTRFFLSVFIHGRTVSLRTYPTLAAALAALSAYRDALQARADQ
jgi:hypothetical protein